MKRYRQAVSALVVRKTGVACVPGEECKSVHEILLVHKPRRNDVWQLPQGGLERDESLQQAAIRELREETGLSVGPAMYVSHRKYRYDFSPEFLARHNPYNQGQSLGFALFTVSPDAKVVVDTRELDTFAWVLPERLHMYIKRKSYLQALRDVWEECKPHLRN